MIVFVDQVINDDFIVDGGGCFGGFCVDGELFGLVELLFDDGGGVVWMFM